jgi:hypothetical protein
MLAGKRVAMRNVSSGTIYYYAEDMLGSSRTDPPGSTSRRPGSPFCAMVSDDAEAICGTQSGAHGMDSHDDNATMRSSL